MKHDLNECIDEILIEYSASSRSDIIRQSLTYTLIMLMNQSSAHVATIKQFQINMPQSTFMNQSLIVGISDERLHLCA